MTTVLLVSDRSSVIDRVHARLSSPEISVIDHHDPETAADVAYSRQVDSVLVDMQVGSMGAMAVTRSVRAKAQGDDPVPVTILLDREADAFLAKRSGAENWVAKNASAERLRAAVTADTADR
ncbi:MAG: response regulator [Acidimicrobiia bacterium]